MAIEIINVGASPNDGNGDPIRDAFIKCNDNFDELDTTKIGGSGTDNFVAKFSGTDSIENSLIFDDGTNVGVNTTTPTTNLEVSGTDYSFSAGRQASNRKVSIGLNDNGQPSIQSFNSSNAPVDLTINPSGGNVGIGTLNPTEKLTIATSSFPGASFYRDLDVLSVGDAGQRILIGARKGSTFTAGASISGVLESSGNEGNIFFQTLSGSSLQERMRIASNGNVGIGTTNPLGILHLYKSGATTRMVVDGDAGQSRIITYRTGGLQRFGMYVNNTSESGSNAGSDFQIRAYNDDGTLLSTPLFIKRSTGNVGIGTTSPTAKIHLSIASASNIFNRIENANGNTYLGLFANGDTVLSADTAGNNLLLYTSASEKMRITSSGNVGIGTTSPGDAKLKIGSGSGPVATPTFLQMDSTYANVFSPTNQQLKFYLDKVSATESYGFGTSSDAGLFYHSGGIGYGYHAFCTSGSEKMRILSNGNVGIGTTSPSSKLQVVGLPSYADNTSALAGGLTVGAFYHTAGVLKVVI